MEAPTADHPDSLAYRIVRSLGTDDWTIVDPLGGALCRAGTRERAQEVVRLLTVSSGERAAEPFAC